MRARYYKVVYAFCDFFVVVANVPSCPFNDVIIHYNATCVCVTTSQDFTCNKLIVTWLS